MSHLTNLTRSTHLTAKPEIAWWPRRLTGPTGGSLSNTAPLFFVQPVLDELLGLSLC